jgi:hypothetical protein
VNRWLDVLGRSRRRLLILDDLHLAGAQVRPLLVYLIRSKPTDLRVVAVVRSGEAAGTGATRGGRPRSARQLHGCLLPR